MADKQETDGKDSLGASTPSAMCALRGWTKVQLPIFLNLWHPVFFEGSSL